MSDSAPAGLVIPEELATRINSALADGRPMVVAYVNGDGQPKMSFRGSAHVHNDGAVALWVRKADGGIVEGIASNPKVTLLYRDAASRTTFFVYGNAHLASTPETIDRIYDESPEQERNADPEKKGTGIIVDVDLIQGRTADGPVNIARA
jgi:general stress protein 26